MADTKIARIEDIRQDATFKIAAVDALDSSKATADYVCDGIADEVEILAIATALATTGGLVRFSEGTFTLSNTVALTQNNICFIGQGAATVITGMDAVPPVTAISSSGSNVSIYNMCVLGATGILNSGGMTIRDCICSGSFYVGIHNLASIFIDNCECSNLTGASTGIILAGTKSTVTNCTCDNNVYGITTDMLSTGNLVTNNHCVGNFADIVDDADGTKLDNNIVTEVA